MALMEEDVKGAAELRRVKRFGCRTTRRMDRLGRLDTVRSILLTFCLKRENDGKRTRLQK